MIEKYYPVYMVESSVVQGAFYEVEKYTYDATSKDARKILYKKERAATQNPK